MRIWTGNNRCGLLLEVRLVFHSGNLCAAAFVLLQVCDNLLSALYLVLQTVDVNGACVSTVLMINNHLQVLVLAQSTLCPSLLMQYQAGAHLGVSSVAFCAKPWCSPSCSVGSKH